MLDDGPSYPLIAEHLRLTHERDECTIRLFPPYYGCAPLHFSSPQETGSPPAMQMPGADARECRWKTNAAPVLTATARCLRPRTVASSKTFSPVAG